ncbi:hypothetical protein HYV84_01460 [Candidatus Woesearchaeota archaeon]|nr:hypothetical protein [Candidatus Woesearchaeota archaeon]
MIEQPIREIIPVIAMILRKGELAGSFPEKPRMRKRTEVKIRYERENPKNFPMISTRLEE